MSYYYEAAPGSQPLETLKNVPTELAKTSLTTTKSLLKLSGTIFQFLLGYLVLDYFVYLWDNTLYFATWRSNDNGEKVRRTVDKLFGDDGTSQGRYLIVMFIYAAATYISSKRYSNSLLRLSGPVAVFLSAMLVELITRFTNKYAGNYGTPCCSDTTVGCQSWKWLTTWFEYLTGQNTELPIVIGIAFGYLLPASTEGSFF